MRTRTKYVFLNKNPDFTTFVPRRRVNFSSISHAGNHEFGQKGVYIRCVFISSAVREQLKDFTKDYDKSENDLKALQSVGQVRNFFEKILHIQLKTYL